MIYPLVLLAVNLSFVRGEEVRNDWLLIPGSRVGPITTHWTGDDLLAAFGTLHCRKLMLPGEWAGDPPREGWLLYPGTADEIEIHLGEDDTVESVIVSDRTLIFDPSAQEFTESKRAAGTTRWRSISGITHGSGVELVEKVNGKPFHIAGWEACDGGIADWREGEIPAGFQVTFSPDFEDKEAYEKFCRQTMNPDAPPADAGDSNSAPIRELAPKVSRIVVRL